jgi:hypothetical protein
MHRLRQHDSNRQKGRHCMTEDKNMDKQTSEHDGMTVVAVPANQA